jgi:hypothetical protein
MRCASLAAWIFGVVLALSASAQQPRPPLTSALTSGVESFAVSHLLPIAAVQEELKLTADQKPRLKKRLEDHQDALQRIRRDQQAQGQRLREQQAPAEEVEAWNQQCIAELTNLHARLKSDVLKVLDRQQRVRLNQVGLQYMGPGAFTHPALQDFRERLNLGPDQMELIAGILAGYREEAGTRALPPEFDTQGLSPREAQARMATKEYKAATKKLHDDALESRGATLTAIAKVLTRKQRRTYEAMLGERFDVAALPSLSGTQVQPRPKAAR